MQSTLLNFNSIHLYIHIICHLKAWMRTKVIPIQSYIHFNSVYYFSHLKRFLFGNKGKTLLGGSNGSLNNLLT